jgi:hypothetical protein
MAPFATPTKAPGLQGKDDEGSGIRALWGQQWARPPFFHGGHKYCHNGGTALRPPSRRRLARRGARVGVPAKGATNGIVASFVDPRKRPLCRGKGLLIIPLTQGATIDSPHV